MRILSILLCWLFLTTPVLAQTTATEWFAKGYGTTDYNEKIRCYSEAIRLNPKYAQAYYNRGYAKSKLKQYAEAITDYDVAIRLDPKDANAHYNRGYAKDELKQYKGAITDYDEAIRLDPNYARAYYNRGYAKNELKQYAEAITDYDMAIRLDPNDANAYNNRGFAKDELKRYAEAITDYDEAIRLDPKYANAYYNRGYAKDELKRYAEAITDYDETIRLDPRFADAYYNRGYVKTKLGRHQEAIADYDEVIRLDPKDANAYLNKGRALVKLGQYANALDNFRQGEGLDTSLTFHLADKKTAQQALDKQSVAVVPPTSKRYALVIGNSNYSFSPKLLGQPVNDAQDVANRLREMGFKVSLATDVTRQQMLDELDEFVLKTRHADVVLLYYSGHGVQDDYENYLVPVDARFITKSDIAHRGISLGGLIGKLGSARAANTVVALDACRNITVSVETATTKDELPKGFKTIRDEQLNGSVYISLASRSGKPALLNTAGRNSYFTAALLKYLSNGKRIESIFRAVTGEVGRTTQQKQQPEIIDRLEGDLTF